MSNISTTHHLDETPVNIDLNEVDLRLKESVLLAAKYIKEQTNWPLSTVKHWLDAYRNAANEKQYTIEDMRKMWDFCQERALNFMDDDKPQMGTFDEYILKHHS